MILKIKTVFHGVVTYVLKCVDGFFYWVSTKKTYSYHDIRKLKLAHATIDDAVAWAYDWSKIYKKEIELCVN